MFSLVQYFEGNTQVTNKIKEVLSLTTPATLALIAHYPAEYSTKWTRKIVETATQGKIFHRVLLKKYFINLVLSLRPR